MFLSAAPIHPFETRTSGVQKQYTRARQEKDLKRPSRAKRTDSKQQRKKPETSSKDLMRSIKSFQNQSFIASLKFFHENFSTISKDQIFQVFLELADSAKRENNISAARKILEISIKIQPNAHQTWLEYSKLEEECGNFDSAFRILIIGLQFYPVSEQIFSKFLKIEEKSGQLEVSRRVLSGFYRKSVEKYWKILMEGAVMEARCGNVRLARYVIHSLIFQCSHFGGLYLEAVRFEEKWGKNLNLALEVCEKGINNIPRYGPLWFAALRISEKLIRATLNDDFKLKQEKIMNEAEKFMSKELIWKLYLDYAVYLYERNELEKVRSLLKKSINGAPENLRWKSWVFAARVEIRCSQFEKALKILDYCLSEVPYKQRPLIYIEKSQLYELWENYPVAQETMSEGWDKSGKDWKVCLERISLELRLGHYPQILSILTSAISENPSTGRLWASLIQTLHLQNSINCFPSFIKAIQEVPKSGEVWCEGGRIRLNPFSPHFSISKAQEYLSYAIQFTPQYGDSFIEMIRVLVLKSELHLLKELKKTCINADPNYGTLWFYCKQHPLDGAREVFKRAKRLVIDEVCRTRPVYENYVNNEKYEKLKATMWIGIREAALQYCRYSVLGLNDKMKLVYGCEGVLF